MYHLPMLMFVYHEKLDDPIMAAIVGGPVGMTDHAELLEYAFEKTNSITCDWRHNHETIPTNLSRRSTSVGDFVQIGIHLYRCDPDGWTHIAPTKWQLIKSFFTGRTS